jgi:Mg-chelatase subunit ChlD
VTYFTIEFRFPSNDQLKRLIDRIPKPIGQSNLDEALKKVRDLFTSAAGARPDANSVLVIITDKDADNSEEEVTF